MKKGIRIIALVSGLSVSGICMAECPSSLSADELVDCIVVEGAGDIHAKSEFKQKQSVKQAKNTATSEARQKQDQLVQKNK